MCPSDITPACHNAADSVSISGPPTSVKKFVEELKSKDIFARMVNSSGVAFHSKYIAPVGTKLRASLDKIIPSPKRDRPNGFQALYPKLRGAAHSHNSAHLRIMLTIYCHLCFSKKQSHIFQKTL